MSDTRGQLLETIKHRGIFRGERILASGRSSNAYYDMRMVVLHPEGAKATALLLLELMRRLKLRQIGGPSVAAVPIVGATVSTSVETGQWARGFFVRPTAKGHGMQRSIEGYFDHTLPALLVDDVATSGQSLTDCYRALKGQNQTVEVKHACVIIDRQEGAAERLAGLGITLHSLFIPPDFE